MFGSQKALMLVIYALGVVILYALYHKLHNKVSRDFILKHVSFSLTSASTGEKELWSPDWRYTELGANLKAFLDGSELEEGVEPGVAYEELTNTSILPPSARIVAKKIFHTKPLVIWATEWHMTPIKDIATILSPFGVVVRDFNLDPWRCAWHDCNAKNKLKFLSPGNVLDLPPDIEESYVKYYSNSSEMAEVDIAYCGYPASLCPIYLRLNKSVLVQAPTRYDVGRYTIDRLNKMNDGYRKLAKTPWNVISGNNLYDAQFITYYTGVKTYHLPSVCDYTGVNYNNSIQMFLWVRRRDHGFMSIFYNDFKAHCNLINCTVKLVELGGYSFESLSTYRGVVHIPYQVSVMSIFEQYRMNMPMFVPSPQLLASWHTQYFTMHELSFEGAFWGKRQNSSVAPPDPSQKHIPDPKDEFKYDGNLHWLRFCDFYQAFPYSVVYESIPHLVHILNTITNHELRQISAKMQAYNIDFKKKLLKKWRAILLRYAANSPNHPH